MWIGNSERNLRSIVDTARRNRPCLLVFEETDALGQKRSHLRGGGSAMRGVVNQMLAELDGAATDNEGVFVLAGRPCS
jgi:SpoVK/Ycf46/Vps4 family AAA+-type ATPase